MTWKLLISGAILFALVAPACSQGEEYALVLANPCKEPRRVLVLSDNGDAFIGPASDQSFQPQLPPLAVTTTERKLISPERLGGDQTGVHVSFGSDAGEGFDLGEPDVIELSDGPALVGVLPAEACEPDQEGS